MNEADEPTPNLRLLADCRRIYYAGTGSKFLSTSALVKALIALPESPWKEYEYGRPIITEHRVGMVLGGYGIQKSQRRADGGREWGRARSAFEDAW